MNVVCDIDRVQLYREVREVEAAILACRDLKRMGELKARLYVLRLKLGIEENISDTNTTYLHMQVEINDCEKVDVDVSAANAAHKSTISFLLDGKEYRISAVELRDMLEDKLYEEHE